MPPRAPFSSKGQPGSNFWFNLGEGVGSVSLIGGGTATLKKVSIL